MFLPHQDKRGYLDVVLSLLDVKDHLLYELIPQMVEPHVSRALQEHFGAVENYRTCVPFGDKAVDLAWQASWPITHKKLSTFVENILYKNVYEKEIKQNVANKQSGSELFTLLAVKEEFDAIKQAIVPKKEDSDEPKKGSESKADNPQDEDDVAYMPPDAEETAQAVIKKYQEQAYVLVDQSVQLVVEAKDAKAMADLLRESWAKFGIDPVGENPLYDIGVYDIKMSGEVVTHPHLRIMSFRDEHWEKMAKAFLRSMLPVGNDALAEVNWPASSPIVLLDGGKGHKDCAFHDPFKIEKKVMVKESHLTIHISEASIEVRRQRQKLTAPLSMCSHETARVYLLDNLNSPYVRRRHYEGSSASSGIGPVAYTTDDDAWVKTFKDKKDIYGKTNRIAPGGRTPGVDSELAAKMKRKDEDREHVFFFTLPWKFYEDLYRCLGARTATGLTLGDAQMAIGAMMAEVPFVGVCLTEQHRNGVRKHLANTVFKGFFTEGSSFYDARIAKDLQEAGLAKAKEAATEGAGEPPQKKLKKGEKNPGTGGGGGSPPAAAAAGADPNPPPQKKPKAQAATAIADKMKLALAALGGSGADPDGGDDEGEDEGGDGA